MRDVDLVTLAEKRMKAKKNFLIYTNQMVQAFNKKVRPRLLD